MLVGKDRRRREDRHLVAALHHLTWRRASATSVLPNPTSPQSRRSIGVVLLPRSLTDRFDGIELVGGFVIFETRASNCPTELVSFVG